MSEYNRHKWAMEWMHGGGRDPHGRSLDEEIRIGKEEWTERQRVAQGGRIGLQSGQLVQPGPGRQGYADKKKTEKLLTKNQVNMMKKNLPEGVGLIPSSHTQGQWVYTVDITKGKRGSKNFERVGKELKATPENLDILIELREKTMKRMYPNRLSQNEFKRLRLEEWPKLTNNAFAEKLNELGYKTQADNWTGKFNQGVVHSRQEELGISKDVGRTKLPIRKISEVKKIIRNSSGGTEFLQVYSGNEKVLRTRANQILNNEKFIKTRGWFPFGTSNEGKLWFSFFKASKGDRIKIVGEFADGNFPRDADGKVDWFKKNKKDIPAWKRIEFEDTEAPKGKQKFKWGNLQADVDKAFGKGYFARNTRGYDLAVMDSQRMWGGQKVGTVLQEKMLMKDLENSIFKKEGVRRKPSKIEIDNWMETRKPGYAMTEAHHSEGVQKNPYKVEPAFRYANRRLNDLESKYKSGKIDKARFIADVEALPGGIRYTMPDGTVIGSKSSEASRLAAAGKESGLLKHKDFRSYLNSRLKKTYARNQAKLFQNLGLKLNRICSSLVAGGGRIGFAEGKVCGMDLVLANPEEFIKASQQDADFIKVLQKNPQRVKKVASKIARHSLHPWSLLGGELWFVGLDTWASRTRGIPLNEALDNAFVFYDFGEGKENLMNVAADLGYSEDQIHGFNQLLGLAQIAQEIPKQEEVLMGYEQSLKGLTDPSPNISREKLAALAPGVAETGFADFSSKVQNQRDYISELEQQHQSDWDSYVWNTSKQTGKDVSQVTDEDLDIGFEGLYKTSEKKVREEIIEAGQERYEDKERYVYPGSSDFGEALFTMWPLTSNWDERRRLQKMSEEELKQHNIERGYQSWEDVVGGESLSPLHMKRLYGRGFGNMYDSLSMLFNPEHMSGGGIAGIRRPNAIPPESGPMPQGGGLSTMFNRVKPW